MKGPGGRFERQVLASVPKWAWARKVPDPPARPFKCRCGGEVVPTCKRCNAKHRNPARFTRRNPWDVEIRWKSLATGVHELLLECKSTEGGKPLPFSVVKADDLLQAAAYVDAGILWESRGTGAVVYLPVVLWLELQGDLGRKSLPLDVALERGFHVRVDADRGRLHTYYRIDELLKALAGVPPAQQLARTVP